MGSVGAGHGTDRHDARHLTGAAVALGERRRIEGVAGKGMVIGFAAFRRSRDAA
jgi:hypothetical protein